MLPPGEKIISHSRARFRRAICIPPLWCDLIEPKGCRFSRLLEGFLRRQARDDAEQFRTGQGDLYRHAKHQHFYDDWCCGCDRQRPDPAVEGAGKHRSQPATKEARAFIFCSTPELPVRIQFYKPMHDFLTGNNIWAIRNANHTACW